ncbi:MAG TPA: LysR family transcriptional regulator [Pseudolabrys sp.]
MRIDFLGLEAFLSIAERGSFQRAAAHLNLSQTAISHRMRKLEDELRLTLLARTTREVTLTRAGIASCRRHAGRLPNSSNPSTISSSRGQSGASGSTSPVCRCSP